MQRKSQDEGRGCISVACLAKRCRVDHSQRQRFLRRGWKDAPIILDGYPPSEIVILPKHLQHSVEVGRAWLCKGMESGKLMKDVRSWLLVLGSWIHD